MANSLIITPDEFEDCLMVDVPINASDEEVKKMLQINQAGKDWLNKRVSNDYYFDLIAEFGFNPYSFLYEVEQDLNLLTS